MVNKLAFFVGLSAAALGVGCDSRERPPCGTDAEITTICGFRNPEDLEYVRSASVLLVSNMRIDGAHPGGGYLSAVLPGTWEPRAIWGGDGPAASAPDPSLGAETCADPPVPTEFRPHGLTATRRDDAMSLVYVAAHAGDSGGREAVEIFELSGEGANAQLTWKACIPSEGGVQLNDLAVSDEGLILASNYLPDPSPVHSVKASIFREPTGDVMTWTREDGWRHLEDTESLLANGVALSPDGKTIFYTETVAGTVHRRSIDSASGAIDIEIDGLPDNLTWTSRGTLLVATHDSGVGLMACLLRSGACRAGWAVYEITPETLAARLVVSHSGEAIGAVATAVEIDDQLLVSSVLNDRIATMPQSGTQGGRNDQ